MPLHLPDILILAAVAALVAMIFLRRKKHRWGGCGGDCSRCAGCSHGDEDTARQNTADPKKEK